MINTNDVETLYYGYSDYQGSLVALANEAGTVVERYAYDPWGKRRNPLDWTQVDTRTSWIINRGYTMHEHLDAFGIINMNGRVYDPLTSSFFSPDPFVQAQENWLNYNRYLYAYGNPFKYTDPSGEFIVESIIIGAIMNGFQNGGLNWFYGGSFWDGFWKGAVVGGLSVAAGAGAGQLIAGVLTPATTLGGAIGNGALIGATGGFAGGFVGGSGNAWINGAGLGEGLKAGLINGGIGALTEGIIGGISGGINYAKQTKFFMEGCDKLDINPKDAIPIEKRTDAFLSDAQKVWYSEAPMDRTTRFSGTNTKSYFTGKYTGAGGMTIPTYDSNGLATGMSEVFFNQGVAFNSARGLYNIMGHELLHVAQIAALAGQPSSLFNNKVFNDLMEFHAYNYRSINNMNSFTREEISNFAINYPKYFQSLSAPNFLWTYNSAFKYPF